MREMGPAVRRKEDPSPAKKVLQHAKGRDAQDQQTTWSKVVVQGEMAAMKKGAATQQAAQASSKALVKSQGKPKKRMRRAPRTAAIVVTCHGEGNNEKETP
ncbi:hypothetical protein KM043_018239 [Ampulex compressa]|nr:hypothetical protein KM043_018239 [Ampulex compressa]